MVSNGSIFHLTAICKKIEDLMQEEMENLFFLEPKHYEYDITMFDTKTSYGFLQGEGYISIRLIVRRDVKKLREEDLKRIEYKLQNLYKSPEVNLACKVSIIYVDGFKTKNVCMSSEVGLKREDWYNKMNGKCFNGFLFTNSFSTGSKLIWANICSEYDEYALNKQILGFESRKLTRLLNRPILIEENKKD